MDSHDEAGCQAPPEGPFLCINNCGFFGSAATKNMCSKCHKDVMLKQDQAKLAASCIENFVNGSSSSFKEVLESVSNDAISVEPKTSQSHTLPAMGSVEGEKPKNEGPKRCNSCNQRVGLTGFNCGCGNVFCTVHRYSDKHDCPFDYHMAAQHAISKANPVVKAQKLDKI
ncbi:zinc finger A20 and AN1 domain-containing stress-associated protein 8-like [Cucurbita maxima]|uniref:Zinc finger A20 and AN1 domain-containing stress-associated protein 8-like n=1 Tax=Cucurbita maxima TaxID=3661 RepID=A0A6J1JI81_CUCMA|nr:zinc finger A20 and AN1 domain-containing stress-associated protein 8-like [Cucurbita maxima]XP_022987013.1 zinc finger A20 and AN1 domain-containing stress-associated protein 8-like [Cucurbita maxima]XP_022987014.1 zinc finger A20 and AN1 domain-containing stress-associated protein 8-like [Cucurbita maxima]XP_022987015.1 zinc finger A20 and AN1 domain-containing stress-associated protein 8-like [Cucurbita maxima]